MMAGAGEDRVDVAFALEGQRVPPQHHQALRAALCAALPWLADDAWAGVHALKLAAGGAAQGLLSRRTRLVLRVPRERATDAAALCGRTLDVGGCTLRVGAAHLRELLTFGTLYAPLVVLDADDEAAFLERVQALLEADGIRARAICGRRQQWAEGMAGYSLMCDGLSPEHARRLLERGLGAHRACGCGVFVPHKSAAAVGAAP